MNKTKKRILLAVSAMLIVCLSGCIGKAPIGNISESDSSYHHSSGGITPDTPSKLSNGDIESIVSRMTDEELVGQCFLVRCPKENAVADVSKYKLSGYILFGRDFQDSVTERVCGAIAAYQAASSIPLIIAVDEEGGTVNRVSLYSQYGKDPFRSAKDIFAEGGYDAIESDAVIKANFLKNLGINVNLAPVCDVSKKGSYMYPRSFGDDASAVSEFVKRVVTGSEKSGVAAVLKHFPGYGDCENTHSGIAYDDRSIEQFRECDFSPFKAGIAAGCGAVLVSHNIVRCMDAELPASLSPAVHKVLREELGFDGVIMTDDIYMKAITEYTGGDAAYAAVAAIKAGNDLIISTEYQLQIHAVIRALKEKELSRKELEKSAVRILKWKRNKGIIK